MASSLNFKFILVPLEEVNDNMFNPPTNNVCELNRDSLRVLSDGKAIFSYKGIKPSCFNGYYVLYRSELYDRYPELLATE